jgi:uncharacterized protein YndB with AHSA1/START domain
MSDEAAAQAGFPISVTRYIASPPAKVWQVMTERLEEYWCPRPWRTQIIEIDWRAGGRMATIMRGPDGEEHVGDGVLLEVTPGVRMVFTDAFGAGWIPQAAFMVGCLEITAEGDGTRYVATTRHWTQEACDQHKAMGFEGGWTVMADQLAALAEAG